MHYTGDAWTDAQVAGLRQQFGELGIEVIAVTDAGFQPDRQVSNIETVLARNPNIIVSIPADPVATAGAYKQAAAAGVKLVFMDNVPQGMQAGRDYVSAVSPGKVRQRGGAGPPHAGAPRRPRGVGGGYPPGGLQ